MVTLRPMKPAVFASPDEFPDPDVGGPVLAAAPDVVGEPFSVDSIRIQLDARRVELLADVARLSSTKAAIAERIKKVRAELEEVERLLRAAAGPRRRSPRQP